MLSSQSEAFSQLELILKHPCYALSLLLHVGMEKDLFHVAGYEWGAGNEDELVQARTLLFPFCEEHPGMIQELITDRGYIDGEFVGKAKQDYDVDILMPLKKNMSTYQDAVEIAKRGNAWVPIEETKNEDGQVVAQTNAVVIPEMDLWQSCSVKQHATVVKTTTWKELSPIPQEDFWVLGSTRKYLAPQIAISRYALRTQMEERNRQLKLVWQIGSFPSPHRGLIESHVAFTLLTYSLLQLYLRRQDLRDQTHRMISTLKQQEALGKNVVIVYAGEGFALLDLDTYTLILTDIEGEPRQRLRDVMQAQKEARLKRGI